MPFTNVLSGFSGPKTLAEFFAYSRPLTREVQGVARIIKSKIFYRLADIMAEYDTTVWKGLHLQFSDDGGFLKGTKDNDAHEDVLIGIRSEYNMYDEELYVQIEVQLSSLSASDDDKEVLRARLQELMLEFKMSWSEWSNEDRNGLRFSVHFVRTKSAVERDAYEEKERLFVNAGAADKDKRWRINEYYFGIQRIHTTRGAVIEYVPSTPEAIFAGRFDPEFYINHPEHIVEMASVLKLWLQTEQEKNKEE